MTVQEKEKDEFKQWERRFGQSSNFPDFVEKWNPQTFYKVGAGATVLNGALFVIMGPTSVVPYLFAAPLAAYWAVGVRDINQHHHAIRKNFPVLGNLRYFFELLRPEIRQYFIESDTESVPFDRQHRSIAYQRAKDMPDTLPFGTRRDVHAQGYEWVNHSMWPSHVPPENQRVTIGGPECKQPYSASILNISAMSYGALSENAILALNHGAEKGNFYHNTGEGGVSRFHLKPGGDIVWNIGTGYFGCRTPEGRFSPDKFKETLRNKAIKMVEIKLSQGAKPAHGGILPKAKVTKFISEARGVPMDEDCISPPRHTAFDSAEGLMHFVAQLRELSDGKPIGFKMCVGQPQEAVALVRAMVDTGITPDFVTIDGGEGGTGAAPPEFSNSVGMPLAEGLTLMNNLLIGAGIRSRLKIIAAGKILTGFSVVKTMALGADVCNSARAMMFALGCIQALKCNTNRCPTGVTTQDPELMKGLVVPDKAARVQRFHQKTVHTALEMVGALGLNSPALVQASHVMRRVSGTQVMSYAELFPRMPEGALLNGTGPARLQAMFDAACRIGGSE